MKKIKVATVFSGIGAAEQALKQLGIEHEIIFACDNGERYINIDEDRIREVMEQNGIDNNDAVKKIYESSGKPNNVKKSYFANYNIKEENWFEDIRFLDGKIYKKEDIDLLIGGSPCQSFSTYGHRKGLEDTRGTLFYDYARLINEVRPKAFIFENVTGLLNHDKGKTWEIIKSVFTELQYRIVFDVLDAQDYGLPQMRKRLFVVGIRNNIKKNFSFPKKEKLKIKAEDLLEKEVPLKYYLGYKGFRYVTDTARNEGRARVNRDIIGCQTANQQFNWTGDFRVELPNNQHLKDEKIYKGEYLGKVAVARKLTPNECLNLMGFNDFKIVVPDHVMYRQCGNSIAVPVIKKIIKNILEVIE